MWGTLQGLTARPGRCAINRGRVGATVRVLIRISHISLRDFMLSREPLETPLALARLSRHPRPREHTHTRSMSNSATQHLHRGFRGPAGPGAGARGAAGPCPACGWAPGVSHARMACPVSSDGVPPSCAAIAARDSPSRGSRLKNANNVFKYTENHDCTNTPRSYGVYPLVPPLCPAHDASQVCRVELQVDGGSSAEAPHP